MAQEGRSSSINRWGRGYREHSHCNGSSPATERVDVETRRIRGVKLMSPDASDILVTLDDGTEVEESFIYCETLCSSHTRARTLYTRVIHRWALSFILHTQAHHPRVELNGRGPFASQARAGDGAEGRDQSEPAVQRDQRAWCFCCRRCGLGGKKWSQLPSMGAPWSAVAWSPGPAPGGRGHRENDNPAQ